MGLTLQVGILADLLENDAEGAEHVHAEFEVLNEHLVTLNMRPHVEPTVCSTWSCDMIGYSGLHYLRRIAAHVDSGGKLPAPGDKGSSDDTCLAAYFADFEGRRPGAIARLLSRTPKFQRRFDHLILHSDAEGYYLPADFERVLILPAELEVAGGVVGSTPRLANELDRLANLLGIPDSLGLESGELADAVEDQGHGDATWQRYGIESYTCVALREACRRSLATGAAISFC